jgi:hypothetical protein
MIEHIQFYLSHNIIILNQLFIIQFKNTKTKKMPKKGGKKGKRADQGTPRDNEVNNDIK